VRHLQDAVGVEAMARGPCSPRALDTLRGVDENAVEVEEDGRA
jgi:hypothetical protein